MKIKFRAWNGKKMRYKVSITYDGHPIRFGYQWFDIENDIYNSEPMQYTGLKDKNGKEIYEGDIVKGTGRCYNYYEDLICVVRYNEEFGAFAVKVIPNPPYENCINFLYQLRDIEVIGNIYDNPELLKGE